MRLLGLLLLVHRQWFDQTAVAERLGTGFAVAEKDRLYRCLDRLLEQKQALFQHGQVRRVWVMDRGILTEALLAEMRDPARQVFYLVGTPEGE